MSAQSTNAALRPRARWADLALPAAVSAILFAIPFSIALESVLHFDGPAIDGPFQLYNALRRIDAGFRPGIDFQFFHGIGIPYLQFAFYVLFGRGLEGSELGRQMLSTLLFPAVFLTVFRVFTRSWRTTWYLTAAALAASIALHLTALSNPLNGMLGLRSTVPTLIPAVYVASRAGWTRSIAVGCCLGLALFLSTEQGMAATLAFVVVSSVALVRPESRGGRLRGIVATVILGVAVFLALVFVVAGRETFGVLRYNFRAVPMDQFWYFGAPPVVFIPSWSSVPTMLRAAWPIGLAIVLGIVTAAGLLLRVARNAGGDGRRAEAFALLALYGLISCSSLLGIFAAAYVQPCWRALIILGLLGIANLAESPFSRARAIDRVRPRAAAWPLPAAMIIAIAWMFVAASSALPILTGAVPHLVRDHLIGHRGFGASGIWPETLRDDRALIGSRRTPGGALPTLWSTYAGWLEAQNATFQPSFDYIIHALGPTNRGKYLATFRTANPRLVQTVRPTYTQYEPWIENTSWPLYEDLLQHYQIVQETPWSLFWERQPADAPPDVPLADATYDPASQVARLPATPPSPGMPVSLLTVEVEYSASNHLAWIPVLGASPRFLVGISGAASRIPVTLDPYTSTARFPIVAEPGSTPALAFRVFSLLPGAGISVHRIRVWQTPVVGPNQRWLAEMVQQQSAH